MTSRTWACAFLLGALLPSLAAAGALGPKVARPLTSLEPAPMSDLLKVQAAIAELNAQIALEQRKNQVQQLQADASRLKSRHEAPQTFDLLRVACGAVACRAVLTDGTRPLELSAGDVFDGFVVVSIQANSVLLTKNGKQARALPPVPSAAPFSVGNQSAEVPPPLPRFGGSR